jgi:hypothetical protein
MKSLLVARSVSLAKAKAGLVVTMWSVVTATALNPLTSRIADSSRIPVYCMVYLDMLGAHLE